MRYLNFIILAFIFGMAGCNYNNNASETIKTSSARAVKAEFRINVNVTDKGLISDRNKILALEKFLDEYNFRGRGLLTISLQNDDNATRQGLINILQTKGIGPKKIVFKISKSVNLSENNSAFRFSGYLLEVPNCSNWSGAIGFNPKNQKSSNFGCSYNRNIGLMLSDPGDIIDPEIYAGEDPSRAPRVLKLFRGGQPTGVSSPSGEKSSASSGQ